MANPNQYYLLADHIKLSLLERQRAVALNLQSDSQDGHIARSLESLRDGVDRVVRERIRLQEAGETSASQTLQDTECNLQAQYDDLLSQFRGKSTSTSESTLTHPNNPSLSLDFARAAERPQAASSSSFLKKSLRDPAGQALPSPKSVRFSDSPLAPNSEDAARAALFPYRDDPTSGPPEQSHLDNQQIHAYHSQVLAEQDEALDRLGESIGRQRELSIQIGDELDEHIQMLDDVDGLVDRHQSRLDRAKKNLGVVARKAKDNAQLSVILILIIILVLLIVVLK